MPPVRKKHPKRVEQPDDHKAVDGDKSVDKTGLGKKDPWQLVDDAILSDDEIMKSTAPEQWKKIALDNGWHPWSFRMNQAAEDQRLRIYNQGIEQFEAAWAKYAGLPQLIHAPGPNVRNVVVEWANQLRKNSGIKGSPIKTIALLHFKGELIDRSSPQLMCTRVEKLLIPACEIATKALEKRLAFFESTLTDVTSEDSTEQVAMYRVIFKKALQDAYPVVKIPTLFSENERIARSERELAAYLVAMSIDEDSAMHRKFFEGCM